MHDAVELCIYLTKMSLNRFLSFVMYIFLDDQALLSTCVHLHVICMFVELIRAL